MSKSLVKTITYLCNQCRKTRDIKINRDYHIAKSVGGITTYNDYHICADNQFIPSILSVDRKFIVRGQRVWGEERKSAIPGPTIANQKHTLENPEMFNSVFSFISIKSELLHMDYTYGDVNNDCIIQQSPSKVYEIKYTLSSQFEENREWIQMRITQALYALDVGQTINNNIISVMVSFIAEHADLKPDYVDQEIIIDLTKSDKIWMKWTSEFVIDYVNHHVSKMFGPGGLNIALRITPFMRTGEFSHYEVSEKSGIDLASTVSIAFMMELWGVLEYVYKD